MNLKKMSGMIYGCFGAAVNERKVAALRFYSNGGTFEQREKLNEAYRSAVKKEMKILKVALTMGSKVCPCLQKFA